MVFGNLVLTKDHLWYLPSNSPGNGFLHNQRVLNHSIVTKLTKYFCGNISGHALMVRPAARLETMELLISSYVLVCIVGKRRWISLYGCYFLIYVIRRPCSLDILLTKNSNFIQRMIPRTDVNHFRKPTKVSYLVQ